MKGKVLFDIYKIAFISKNISTISEYQKDTYFFKNDVQQWKKGPPMAKTRRYHGCGAFTLQNQLVLVVAGDRSSTNIKSVEFLLPNTSELTWIAGKKLFVYSCNYGT